MVLSSSGWKTRPSAAWTPSRGKYWAETISMGIRSGFASSVRLKFQPAKAATSW